MPADTEEQHLSDVLTIGEQIHNSFKSEANRLRTFEKWPEEVTQQSGSVLARAGFYYSGDKTTVQCFECGGRLDVWLPGDRPLEKHIQHFPNCKFVKGVSDNIPLVDSTGNSSDNISDDSGNSSSSPLSSSPPNMSSASSGSSSDENDEQFLRNQNQNRDSNVSDLRQTMKLESNRLKTFYINDECVWPVPGVSPQELARSGFHYLNDDRVQCAFCTGVISNWTPGLRPLEEHSKHFPLCPFIMEEDVGNIPITFDPIRDPMAVLGHDVCGSGPMPSETLSQTILGIGGRSNSATHLEQLGVQLYSGPKNPDMGPLDIRKASFQNSGWDNNCPVSIDRLAEAGFYYIGFEDAVKCFHCDLGLAQWEEGDDPWIEHAKKYPECNFLKLNKSQSFLDECKLLEENSRDDENQGSNDDIIVGRIIDQWLTSDLLKEFVSLNLFPMDLIKRALYLRYYNQRSQFVSFADLYEAVSSLTDGPASESGSRQIESVIEVPTAQTSQQQSNNEQTNENNPSQSSNSTINSSTASQSEIQSNINIENDLNPNNENRLLCKLCYLAEIEVVFLACGHQLACSQCAQRLTDCPVCRQPIRGYVRTFFS